MEIAQHDKGTVPIPCKSERCNVRTKLLGIVKSTIIYVLWVRFINFICGRKYEIHTITCNSFDYLGLKLSAPIWAAGAIFIVQPGTQNG